MFLQACVCPQGGCLPQCMLGNPHKTRSDTPQDQVPPGPGPPPKTRSTPQDQVHPPQAETPAPSRDMATAADGTHPTGMHSCTGKHCCLADKFILTNTKVKRASESANSRVFHSSHLIKRLRKTNLQKKFQRFDQGLNPDCLLSC